MITHAEAAFTRRLPLREGIVFEAGNTVELDEIRRLVLDGKYFFYTHALTEAKKDGVTPEDAIYAILTGEVIEEYPTVNESLSLQCSLTKFHCTSLAITRRAMWC